MSLDMQSRSKSAPGDVASARHAKLSRHTKLPPHCGDENDGTPTPEHTGLAAGDGEGGAEVIPRCNSAAHTDLQQLLSTMEASLGQLGLVHSKLCRELQHGCLANGFSAGPLKDAEPSQIDSGAPASACLASTGLHSKHTEQSRTQPADRQTESSVEDIVGQLHSCQSVQELLSAAIDEAAGIKRVDVVKLTPWERAHQFVSGPEIDVLACFLIVAYVIILGLKLQYDGIQYGYLVGFEGMDKQANDLWPGADQVFQAIDYAFTIIFTLEVILRIFVFGIAFWKLALNWLDFLVVVVSLVEIAIGDNMNLMVVRSLRIIKLGRAFRILKMHHITESLTMLFRCLRASVGTLFWSLLVLIVIQCVCGMALMYAVSHFFMEDKVDHESKILIFKYSGTYSRTMLTMFELLFANWIVPTRVFVEHVSEWFSLAFVIYRLLVGFAVLNVVNAVFVQSTMKVAQQDDEFVEEQKRKASEIIARKVNGLFHQLDTSGDGLLSWEEFQALLKNPVLTAFMHSVDVEAADLEILFEFLDGGDGEIDAQEFTDGILALKGSAKSIDLHHVMAITKRLEKKVDSLSDYEHARNTLVSKSNPPHPSL